MRSVVRAILACSLLCPLGSAECLDFTQAHQHIGETRCVTGRVVHVEQGAKGIHYLDFCEDYRICTFTVVVFAPDLKHVGDVRQLKGKVVEVHGAIKDYDGRAEIVLREARQLSGESASIPPLPKAYDVEHKGKYSAGTYRRSTTKPKTPKKRHPAKLPIDVPDDSPE